MKLICGLAAIFVMAQLACADGWHKVGSLQAGGGGKELNVQRSCSQALIKATEGAVTVKEIVAVDEGGEKAVKVGGQLNAGQSREVGLGGKRKIAKLRLSDDGKGKYDVYVK